LGASVKFGGGGEYKVFASYGRIKLGGKGGGVNNRWKVAKAGRGTQNPFLNGSKNEVKRKGAEKTRERTAA